MPPRIKRRSVATKDAEPASTRSAKAEIIETVRMPLRNIQVYYRNPRIGDIGMIAESLEANGQFRPILVNLGHKTGRKNEVLAGNHTFLAARHLGWTHILASVVNVDEDRARRIVLADNKTAEAGSYDPQELDAILKEVREQSEDLKGTGFTPEEQAALDKRTKKLIEEAAGQTEILLAEIEEQRNPEDRKREREERLEKLTERRAARKQEEIEEEETEAEQREDEAYAATDSRFKDVPEELPGTEKLKEPSEVTFPGVGVWGIPELMDDMLIQWDEVPDNMHTWAGSATREMDQSDITWLYNWNIDSTSGMKDLSQMYVSFYAFDRYFDDWWKYADRYTAKLLNMGVQGLLTPDWTMMNTRCESLMALFKSRWVGRYVQEAGIPIIPHISWPDGDSEFLKDFVLPTLPVGTPVIAMQLQTIDPDKVAGGLSGYFDMIKTVFDEVQPEGAILYVGKQAARMIEDGTLDIPVPAKILMARQFYLSQRAKTQKKKIIK